MPEPRRTGIRTRQPAKAIWTAFTIAFNLARLPLWYIFYVPKFTRPSPKWTWAQAVRMRVVRAFMNYASEIEIRTPTSLEAGEEKDQWVVLQPAKSHYFIDITTQDPEIRPSKIGGTWYPRVPNASDKRTLVVLHFHGGAYVIGSGRKRDAGFLGHTLNKYADVPFIFCPQYRLASNPGGRFPAALQDAITSYTYLIDEMGFSPNQIVVGGDSAGGNLTLALLRYLTTHGSSINLSMPKSAWLWSPWVDPPTSISDRDAMLYSPHYITDYLNTKFGAWGAECLSPSRQSGIDPHNNYIRFVDVPLFKLDNCPVWISAGGAEVLFHDIIKFHEQFSAVPGQGRVELSIEDHAPHDIILTGKNNGFHLEAKESARKVKKFMDSLSPSTNGAEDEDGFTVY